MDRNLFYLSEWYIIEKEDLEEELEYDQKFVRVKILGNLSPGRRIDTSKLLSLLSARFIYKRNVIEEDV